MVKSHHVYNLTWKVQVKSCIYSTHRYVQKECKWYWKWDKNVNRRQIWVKNIWIFFIYNFATLSLALFPIKIKKNFFTLISFFQFSCSVISDFLRPHESQHARPPCPSPTPGVYSNSCPLSWWCHPAIPSSVVPFSSCPQSLPASESVPMSQLFTWGGQSIGVLALVSVLPMNTQDWFPLKWTGWISLQSKRLSRVFSNTTVQNHHFFGAQLSSQSNSHIHTWPQEKP